MSNKFDHIIRNALYEDLGSLGDITTMALFDENAVGEGQFIVEQDGVLSGVKVLERCFFLYDHSVIVKLLKEDGQSIKKGEVIAEIKGKIRSLLVVERTALNFVSHLSGIATLTKAFVEKIKDTGCQLMDTRKTTPGLRLLEKMAVKHGGGLNHRVGLFDGILIKDNHLAAINSVPSPLRGEGQGGGDLAKAVNLAKAKHPDKPVEIEVENLVQVNEALEAGADILLLDNMDEDKLGQAVKIIGGKAKTEASGGINQQNISQIARTGVDFISTSAITMAAPPLDISFEIS